MTVRAHRLDPPLLTEGPLSGVVFIVTVGRELPDGLVESTTKYDITDQFEALARRRGWTLPKENHAAMVRSAPNDEAESAD